MYRLILLSTFVFLLLNTSCLRESNSNKRLSYSKIANRESKPAQVSNVSNTYSSTSDLSNRINEGEHTLDFFSQGGSSFYNTEESEYVYLYLDSKAVKYESNNEQRIPLNISLVIDKSGSMSGEKLENAKEAAKYLVNNLKSEDYVSIVEYDSDVNVIRHSKALQNKSKLLQSIDRIKSGSSTFLSGGMDAGYKEVEETFKNKRVNRVLLMSDGLANVGITTNRELMRLAENKRKQKSISISTFGIGADFNEAVMTGIAEMGSGNYAFIEKPGEIPEIVAQELNGLLNVVAQNTTMEINYPGKLVTLDEVYGYEYENEFNKVIVNLNDVISEEQKAILIRFKIKDNSNTQLSFNCALNYEDAINDKKIRLENNISVEYHNDPSFVVKHSNSNVMQQTAVFEANKELDKAMVLVDKNEYKSAEKLLDKSLERIDYLEKRYGSSKEIEKQKNAISSYDNKIEEVKKMNARDKKVYQKSEKFFNYSRKKKK